MTAPQLRSALWLPLFDDLAAPTVVAGLAAAAEEAGWDGCVATITDLRSGETRPYDVAVGLPFDVDPAPYAAAGATWWLPEFEPGVQLDTIRGVLRDGPAGAGGE